MAKKLKIHGMELSTEEALLVGATAIYGFQQEIDRLKQEIRDRDRKLVAQDLHHRMIVENLKRYGGV